MDEMDTKHRDREDQEDLDMEIGNVILHVLAKLDTDLEIKAIGRVVLALSDVGLISGVMVKSLMDEIEYMKKPGVGRSEGKHRDMEYGYCNYCGRPIPSSGVKRCFMCYVGTGKID